MFDDNKELVLKICYRFFLNKNDAQDISQEVFIEAAKSIGTFNAKSKISTWLHTIATRKCIDELRRRKSKKHLFNSGNYESLNIYENLASEIKPDLHLEKKEELLLLKKFLTELPERQELAFTLSRIKEIPREEIQEIMKLSQNALDILLSRAKKNLQDKIRDFYEKDEKIYNK